MGTRDDSNESRMTCARFMKPETKEPQNQLFVDTFKDRGLTTLGMMSNQVWLDDPKRLAFVLSRYKFVAKLFSGMTNVLEVGCADAFGTRIVQQEVGQVVASDFDPVFINDVVARIDPRWPLKAMVHDMVEGPLAESFDGVYAIDVLEHIPPANENRFIGNIAASLAPHGVCIVGSPSIQSQAYASQISKEGHINCKDAPGLKLLMARFFHNVFIFSMNDEVVHTGFYPLAHYLFAVACSKRERESAV